MQYQYNNSNLPKTTENSDKRVLTRREMIDGIRKLAADQIAFFRSLPQWKQEAARQLLDIPAIERTAFSDPDNDYY